MTHQRRCTAVEEPAGQRRLRLQKIHKGPGQSTRGGLQRCTSAARRNAIVWFWINEPTKVFVARSGVHELTTTILSDDQVRDLVEKMLKSSGRRVDLSAPFVDAC
jgi:Flp pilus assembly CpaF family ATPase